MPQANPPLYRVLVEKDVPMTTRDAMTLHVDVCRTTRIYGRAEGISTTLSSAGTE